MEKLIITLDNGHGSDYIGKQSPILTEDILIRDEDVIFDNRFREYLFNRKIVDMLIEKCKDDDWIELHKIVPEITDVSLSERKRRINEIHPHLSISIHANAIGYGNTWEKAKGFSIWTSKGQTKSDIYAEMFYKNFTDFYQGEIKILRELSDGDSDYEANFAMNMVNCPAILIETAFYTNKQDVQTLMSKIFQENFVTILRNSLIDVKNNLNI